MAAPSLLFGNPARKVTVRLTFFTHEQNRFRSVRICFRTERQKWIHPVPVWSSTYTAFQSSVTMLQFIVDLCNRSYEGESWKEVETMFWILSKIDQKKLIDRVWNAMDDPTKQTKVVLCEYNYTTKQSVEAGYPNIVDRLPNGVLIHDAMYREDFVTLMTKTFCLNDKIVWYRRRKVTREGVNDIHRMQVVLLFKEGAFSAPPPPPPASPVVECRRCDGPHWTYQCPDDLPPTPPPASPTRLCPGAPLARRTNGGGIHSPTWTNEQVLPPESEPFRLECRNCAGAHWTITCPSAVPLQVDEAVANIL